MPRFYFDVQNGAMITDGRGQECADLPAARTTACRKAAELLDSASDSLWRDGIWTVWVRDEQGQRLFSLRVAGSHATADRDMRDKDHVAAWNGWGL